jgi:cellulose synthase/poly-beta-1,6-N-acetylglucosamine synthase-like glycosyltransferase
MAALVASRGIGQYIRQHFLDTTFRGLYRANAFDMALLVPYFVVLILLASYGMHRYVLVYLYYKHRKNRTIDPGGHFADLPLVTVQLPIFNEQFVVERLVDAICRLQYPTEKLDVQLLDDSTDETQAVARGLVERYAAQGFPISYHHRTNREGFKAGALAEGMETARGEFIGIFDADFVPPEDFLLKVVHHFTDPKIGMVQTRWTHINRNYSFLTEVEAILLDGHFVLEHSGRARSGVFFNFNGTAGMWRRTAIEEAGGWQHDTLTEDTDLSYRAQLKGWKFIYLQDVECPAELPVEMTAFKTQQARWAKGLIQTSKKILPSVMKSDQPFRVKLEAWYHLTANLSYPLMVLLSVLLLPAMIIRFYQGWFQMLYIDLPVHGVHVFDFQFLPGFPTRVVSQELAASLALPSFPDGPGHRSHGHEHAGGPRSTVGAKVGIRTHSEVSGGVQEGPNQRHQIPSAPGMDSLARASDRQLFRAYRLLRHRQ